MSNRRRTTQQAVNWLQIQVENVKGERENVMNEIKSTRERCVQINESIVTTLRRMSDGIDDVLSRNKENNALKREYEILAQQLSELTEENASLNKKLSREMGEKEKVFAERNKEAKKKNELQKIENKMLKMKNENIRTNATQLEAETNLLKDQLDQQLNAKP